MNKFVDALFNNDCIQATWRNSSTFIYKERTDECNCKSRVLLRQSLLVMSISLAIAGNVEAVLIDSFDDGNDNGWSHIDNTTSSPWGPAIFDASSGSYTLATTGIVSANPAGISDTFGSQWTGSSDPQFSNGFFRAKMRANTEGTLFFLILRQTGGNGYAFGGATAQNTFFISRVDNSVNVPLQELSPPPSPIAVGQDWIVEAGAVGSQLSLKVSCDGQMEPAAPQLSLIDPTYSSGRFLVSARKDSAYQGTGQVSATFDDIVFTVPEPSACLLLMMALGGMAISARRRTKGPAVQAVRA